eukprot:12213672-Heterocapsa_arctica.AAC.1
MRPSTCSRRASASPCRARTAAEAARAGAAAAATQGGPGPRDTAVPVRHTQGPCGARGPPGDRPCVFAA